MVLLILIWTLPMHGARMDAVASLVVLAHMSKLSLHR